MKYILVLLISVSLLTGCAAALRSEGEPYSGYSCEESLIHFYSFCTDKTFTKEEIDAEVRNCNNDLSSKVCDKELADVLWCMGRVVPGTFTSGGAFCRGWICFSNASTVNGCDCAEFTGALKECRMKLGRREKAPEPIKANNSMRKFSPEAVNWTEKSTKHAETKNWTEMIRTASAAIAIDPSYPEAYVNRSWAYLEMGFPEKAFEDCGKALSLDRNNPGALNNRGLFYLRKGEKDKARDDFLRACNGGLEVSCNNFKLITGYKPKERIDFSLKKAEECFKKKDWDGVIKYTSDIISDNPQNEMALSIRAGAYAYKGMFNEAIKDCDDAIKLNPDLALSYNNKGFAFEMMGKKKEALLNYEFACNLKLPLACENLKKLRPAALN